MESEKLNLFRFKLTVSLTNKISILDLNPINYIFSSKTSSDWKILRNLYCVYVWEFTVILINVTFLDLYRMIIKLFELIIVKFLIIMS